MIPKSTFRNQPELFTVIDVRSAEERNITRLPDSLHIPLAELHARWTEISILKPIAVVCGKGGGRSIEGAAILALKGFNADWLEGGTLENIV
jgi:rhodanese-related sulfurtransferase